LGSFLENVKDRSDVKYRQNKGQGETLAHTNICLERRKTNLFQMYWVFLLIKLLEKKLEILELKQALSKIKGRRLSLMKRKN